MIGAMPAVAVRHERRKKKSKDKRPKKLLLKPYQGGQNDGTMSPTTAHTSRGGSRAGSPTHGTQNGTYIHNLHHMFYFVEIDCNPLPNICITIFYKLLFF